MSPAALLEQATAAGVILLLDGGRLRARIPPGADAELLAALRERKGELLAALAPCWLIGEGPDAPLLGGPEARAQARLLLADSGWCRFKITATDAEWLIVAPSGAPASIPEEYAALPRYTLAEARAALCPDAPLWAEVGHISPGVAEESQPDAAGP